MNPADPTPADYDFFDGLTNEKPIQPPPKLISEWIQGRRVLPAGTPFPGPWDNAMTPYFIEIMDCMSPYSAVQHVVLMKSRKVGATTMAENVAGYWIANPAPQLYVTASQALAKEWASDKLPALLSSLKLQEKITTSNIENAKSRRTGDTTFKKEYFGGSLDITSADSVNARRAQDKRVLLRDEIDGVSANTTTGEGNWLEVNEGHTMSWGARRKIMDFSSPTTEESSNIWRYYLKGDCRTYRVPCPNCQTMQELVFGSDETRHGLKAIINETGEIIEAVYICIDCGLPIKNHQKTEMLKRGQWKPTRMIADQTYRSYHLSSLYAPADMFSWLALYKKYLQAIQDPDDIENGMRSFQNLYLGLPYKEKGIHPELDTVGNLRMDYDIGTAPAGVIYVTTGGDVQHDRVEIEGLGIGEGYRTWSLDYRIFDGPTDDAFSGAWELVYQAAVRGDFTYTRTDGVKLVPRLMFFDSGDAQDGRDEVVQQFCQRLTIAFPIKGRQDIKVDPRRHEKGDVPESSDHKKYRASRIGESDRFMYILSTNHYKNVVYKNLSRPHNEAGQLPAGGCGFPRDYPDEYFLQLTSEERRADGSYHKIRTRNEALDTRVYALAASDVWLDNEVKRFREWFADHVRKNWKREPTSDEMNSISYTYVLFEINKRQTPVRQIS